MNYKQLFESSYERGKQANVRIGELLRENDELRKLAIDLGKENDQLRLRNEQLLSEKEQVDIQYARRMNNVIELRRKVEQYEKALEIILYHYPTPIDFELDYENAYDEIKRIANTALNDL